jgi:hypothetical protein
MPNLEKIKMLKNEQLIFFTFLILFKKILNKIKNLTLENVYESTPESKIYINEHYNDIVELLKNLTNLEKLDISFNKISNYTNCLKILSNIVSLNPNLKILKIKLRQNVLRDQEPKKDRIQQFLINFIKLKKEINNPEKIEEIQNLEEFTYLIKSISSLHNLSVLHLDIPMDENMTTIFNSNFNVGQGLTELKIVHGNTLDLFTLLMLHPNLNCIDLNLLKDKNEDDFQYKFAERSWRSITLNCYPLNNSLVNGLMNCKNSLKFLTLNNTVNISDKQDIEIYELLMEIKNKINN